MKILKFITLLLITNMTVSPALAEISADTNTEQAVADCDLTSREVVENFTEMLFGQRQVRAAFETWVREDYIQHKPSIADGREPVIEFLEDLFDRFPGRIFTIHRFIDSNDLVAVHYHSQANIDDLGFAVVDIFRVENCLIAEHWDVVQPVPAESSNNNTMF